MVYLTVVQQHGIEGLQLGTCAENAMSSWCDSLWEPPLQHQQHCSTSGWETSRTGALIRQRADQMHRLGLWSRQGALPKRQIGQCLPSLFAMHESLSFRPQGCCLNGYVSGRLCYRAVPCRYFQRPGLVPLVSQHAKCRRRRMGGRWPMRQGA